MEHAIDIKATPTGEPVDLGVAGTSTTMNEIIDQAAAESGISPETAEMAKKMFGSEEFATVASTIKRHSSLVGCMKDILKSDEASLPDEFRALLLHTMAKKQKLAAPILRVFEDWEDTWQAIKHDQAEGEDDDEIDYSPGIAKAKAILGRILKRVLELVFGFGNFLLDTTLIGASLVGRLVKVNGKEFCHAGAAIAKSFKGNIIDALRGKSL